MEAAVLQIAKCSPRVLAAYIVAFSFWEAAPAAASDRGKDRTSPSIDNWEERWRPIL
jgi:hypothetical protein